METRYIIINSKRNTVPTLGSFSDSVSAHKTAIILNREVYRNEGKNDYPYRYQVKEQAA